jgi:integrase
VTGQPPKLAPPKTNGSYRNVPLPSVVIDALAAHVRKFGEGPDRLIFTKEHRQPTTRTRFSDTWRPAVVAAGVPGATFHDLRHHYASVLIRAGQSVKVVQERLGHATATERSTLTRTSGPPMRKGRGPRSTRFGALLCPICVKNA